MKRVDLKYCDFCIQGDKRLHYKPRTRNEIEQVLINKRANGYEEVVFTGGEPTVNQNHEVMSYVRKALDIGRAAGFNCMTEAIPFCLMRGYEWVIAEYNFMPETTVVDAEYRTDNYADYRWNEGKAKREDCKKCIRNSVCEGPWKEYPQMYGWEEFVPITETSLTT